MKYLFYGFVWLIGFPLWYVVCYIAHTIKWILTMIWEFNLNRYGSSSMVNWRDFYSKTIDEFYTELEEDFIESFYFDF